MENWSHLFKKKSPEQLQENVFTLIGKEWFLITAGTSELFNTMTASWGTMGILWNKPIAMCFVRPTRHTYNFMEESDYFTLSFLGDQNKEIHTVCGRKSGRDTDKIKETGLIPVLTEKESITFEQAHLCLECKKIYLDNLNPVFMLPDNIDSEFYNENDYHRFYIGEILNVYQQE